MQAEQTSAVEEAVSEFITEGFALAAQRLPHGHVVGMYGTHGSFGMRCAAIKLPEAFTAA